MKPLLSIIEGQEKAVVAGAAAGVLSLLAMVGITGDLTVKEVVIMALNWGVVHLLTWLKANSK